jgi:hypothetical protein
MSDRIVPIIMISFGICFHGISKRLEDLFWHSENYQLMCLSEQVRFEWGERGGYFLLDAGVEIEIMLVGDPLTRWEARSEIMWIDERLDVYREIGVG